MKVIPPDPRVERARMGLILDAPFFGSLIVRLPLVRDDSRPTLCTDGKVIRYNRAFADSLTDDELKYVLCHEIMHCSMGHLWRMAGRDTETWNKACDYAVNQMLDDYASSAKPMPWVRPKGMLNIADKPQWRGLSAEEIYQDMMQERRSEEQKQPQAGNNVGEDGEAQPPNGPSEDGMKGHQRSTLSRQPSPGLGDFESPPPDPNPQPGMEPGAESGLEQDWQIATVQAERIANMKGNCPGAASHLVDELKKPKVSWREVLRAFIRVRARADYNFSRPNRRHLGRGFILPSLHSERMGRFVAAFDSSGSTRRFVGDFQAEVQAALDECLPERIDVIVCDAKVQHVQSFEPGDTVTIDAKGGGGTNFRPVFEHIDGDPNEDEPPVCVVYLTDLDGSFPSREPDYPVLWCVPSGLSGRRTPPFGEIVTLK